ncbi:MAG: hypothetical protein ABWY35_05995 [Pseudorhodoplanes sp.]
MNRDRIAGIGFQHPVRNARPLTKRKIAIAHLVMTALLVICIVIAATAVTFGMARADTLTDVASDQDGSVARLMPIGTMLVGTGDVVAVSARRS